MLKLLIHIGLSAILFLLPAIGKAESFSLSLLDAERLAIDASNAIKSMQANESSSRATAEAQFSLLYPKLTLDGNYRYLTNVPDATLPLTPHPVTLPFGTHENYAIGPTLTYTLWDDNGIRNSYRGLDLLAEAMGEERKNGEIQLVFNVRNAYLRLQLALEELRLLNSSLLLSQAQNQDIESNYRAGAATKLDRVDSQRDVINYQLQFKQKQAEVAADLKDLLAYLPESAPVDANRPGPPGVFGIQLEIHLDSLEQTLQTVDTWQIKAPDDLHPSLLSMELRTESAQKAAASRQAALYPTIQVSANSSFQYPNGIIPESVIQNTFMLSLTMPIFEADHNRHLANAKLLEADATNFQKQQIKIDLQRDFAKASELLQNLREQNKLVEEDVERSAAAAQLYYQSYKGGKINLIDVQSANNRALMAKVSAARIHAQIINQLYLLRSLSGETK